jgi:hypothetical protein
MQRIVLTLLLLSVPLGLLACGGEETYELRIREARLEVELAVTPESRARGLMYRERLPEQQGMLFVFEDSRPRSFWMKDTLIPLSIAYMREDWVILEIYEMEPESLEPVPSINPARYALEVNRGFFEKHGIEPGAKVYPSEELLNAIPSER